MFASALTLRDSRGLPDAQNDACDIAICDKAVWWQLTSSFEVEARLATSTKHWVDHRDIA